MALKLRTENMTIMANHVKLCPSLQCHVDCNSPFLTCSWILYSSIRSWGFYLTTHACVCGIKWPNHKNKFRPWNEAPVLEAHTYSLYRTWTPCWDSLWTTIISCSYNKNIIVCYHGIWLGVDILYWTSSEAVSEYLRHLDESQDSDW